MYKFEASQGPHIKTLSQNKQIINNQTNKILNEKSQGSGLSGEHSSPISATCQLVVWGPYLPCKRGVELQWQKGWWT